MIKHKNIFDFVNDHEIFDLRITKGKYDKDLENDLNIVFFYIKTLYVEFNYLESIFLSNQSFYKKNYKFINFKYYYNKIKFLSYPLKNNNFTKHHAKELSHYYYYYFKNKMINENNFDIVNLNSAFYKANTLSLQSSKNNSFSKIKINGINNLEYLFKYENKKYFDINLINIMKNYFLNKFKTDIYFNLFNKCLTQFTQNFYFVKQHIENNLQLPKQENVIFGSDQKLFTKVLRSVLSKKGYSIISFEHGANTSLFKSYKNNQYQQRLLNVNKYIYTGVGQKKTFEDDNIYDDRLVLSKNYEPKLKSIINRNYLYSDNKRILYVLNSLKVNSSFLTPFEHTKNFYKKIYLKIIKFLEENNYDYNVKPHPDNYRHFQMTNQVNHSFTKCLKQFDTLIFDHSVSTAFNEALISNKKIILINLKQNIFTPRFDKIIKKRCFIINGEVDIYNNVFINLNNLNDIINSKNVSIEYRNDIINFFSPK